MLNLYTTDNRMRSKKASINLPLPLSSMVRAWSKWSPSSHKKSSHHILQIIPNTLSVRQFGLGHVKLQTKTFQVFELKHKWPKNQLATSTESSCACSFSSCCCCCGCCCCFKYVTYQPTIYYLLERPSARGRTDGRTTSIGIGTTLRIYLITAMNQKIHHLGYLGCPPSQDAGWSPPGFCWHVFRIGKNPNL